MKLRTYIEQKGGRLSRTHPELLRLADAMPVGAYTLYMVALGHKTLGARKALALSAATDSVVPPSEVCPAVFAESAIPLLEVG